MSHLNPGLISAYNSLTDRHLAGYFSNSRIRRHLQRAGLITRSGRIVPDKEYRHKLIQRAHHRHVRECLAQAIFHKVLEMERVHQIEIKRKLEEFARRERVHKIKVDRSKIYEEEIIRILSPRPPTGARGIRKQHSGPEGEHSESSESPGSSRPNTAPGKMQRPVRLKPIGSNSTTASLRRSSPYRLLESSNENEQTLNSTMEKESRRHRTTAEPPRGISPYCLPVINNFVTPVPPSTKRRERGVKVTPSGTLRGRRLRPTTASSGVDAYEDPPMLRSSVLQSRVRVNMMYFGKTVHLSHDLTDMRDEVKVFQQHCGGENLCVYKGKLREGETFQFISRRHRGFPFSLTFFLNGLQVERLSSCCEFKHRKGSRLGGRHGHFGFCGVEGASPCYKCIIAMGLDKKPTPPPKRVKDDGVREESVSSLKEAPVMETERTADNESECETSRPQDMETEVKEETAAEDKVRDDYEEDFEADDEGPVEDAEVKVKKSPSPSQETESRALKGDASETEDDEKEEDIKSASGSSSSDSEREESDAEVTKEDEKAENIKEVDPEETAVPLEAATEALPAAPKDSDKQDTAGDSTEIEVCETSVPSANENQQTKSVQQKLAEAILKESQCSSEPELSDTSTEEEEEKGPEPDSKDAVAVKSITLTEELQAVVEETKCEEEVVSEAEEVQETSDPKEQEEESEQEPQENKDVPKDVKIEEENEKDKNTENVKSEEAEDAATALHPVSEEEMADEDKTSEHQESAKSANEEALEKDNETEEENDVEVDTQLDETGHGAKSSEEDESSVSEPNQIPDETAAPDDAEAMTASETKEMKAEPSEEREAVSCEEAPVTHTETRQQGGSEDAETEGTAENSSSSMEGSGDTTVEKRADLSEENAKDESSKDDIKEASAVEESKDGVEEEEDDESKTEERIEKEEIISERTEVDFKDEGNANEEQAEKSQSEEDEVANEEKADELEKTEKDEDGESVKNKNDEEESEEKGDETIESEKVNTAAGGEKDEEESEEKGDETDTAIESEKINTAAGGGKDEEEKDNIDDKSEKDKDEEGSEEKQEESDKTPDRTELPETPDREEKMSEIMEESEKSAGADLDKDNAKMSDDNIVESEDVEDSKAENVVQGTETTEETSNNVMSLRRLKKKLKK
ncbi:Glutamate-rich protein 3 [Dissostichus eleginoides]|uniref:Glutamate-rich protein 3 n=1 Tax=Dissostichus eleginoides TaxID=100907 RepID=A0AAD9FBY0_DISEL|nr:Glutamate-rich protein 3 [Dissostichus eleginoides]